MINRVVLVGRITKDPELRHTPNGVAVTNFTLAVNRTFKNKQGEREADFIPVIAWKRTAENFCTYMKKGGLVSIDGRIQTRNYENNEGKRVYVTEVVAEQISFIERPAGGSAPANPAPSKTNNQGNQNDVNQFDDLFGGNDGGNGNAKDLFGDLPL